MTSKKGIFAFTFFLLPLFFSIPKAHACASCGSGGDDPLVLYPNDQAKDYIGLSQSSNFKNVSYNGKKTNTGGPTAKQTLTIATGRSISIRSFFTFSIPYIRNIRGSKSMESFGDPSLAFRYTAIMPSIDEPYIPQVQFAAGYKVANGRSIHESNEMKTQIDVFGSGFSELRAGIDIWYGITRLKPGFSHFYSLPKKRSFSGTTYEPGLISRTTLSLGYNWFEHWKTTFGVNREHRRAFKIDGVEQKNSTQLNHGIFLTSDYMLSPDYILRASISQQGALLENSNTAKFDTFSIALMHSF